MALRQANSRTKVLLAIAKENKLDVELVTVNQPLPSTDTEYLKLNPLGKIPTFVGANGYILTEVIAIAIYLTSQNEKTTLLGKTKQDYASILRWMSYTNSELLPNLGHWFRPLVGMDPYNKKNVDEACKTSLKAIKTLEQHLLVHTFLVGERLTLADVFTASLVSRAFEYVLDKKFRAEHPSFARWYETIVNQPIWKAVVAKTVLVDEAVKYTPPKKEAKPKEAPKEKAPKAKAVDEEEDEPAPAAPKQKHPLEALDKPTLIIDDWKRKYSNEETREVALPWFWEQYKPSEYSLWRVDYKYNDELTLTFMSANLI
ncbi:MAG: hypothetical protein Q9227_003008, partial [Pyrenula ochraceoflavens]